MKALKPIGILLGIVLLLIAIGSSIITFNLRAQQTEAPQPTIETVP